MHTNLCHRRRHQTHTRPAFDSLERRCVPSTAVGVPPHAAVLTGVLDPRSDGGVSSSDGIVGTSTPRFLGTAGPGWLVQLYARPQGQTDAIPPILLGTTTADAAGRWQLTARPLADGVYTLAAVGTAPGGAARAIVYVPASTPPPGGPLVIDTTAPIIVNATVDPRAGRWRITFADGLSGLDPRALANLQNYALIGLFPPRGLPLRLSGPAINIVPSPRVAQNALVTLNEGRRLRLGGYLAFVSGAGIEDRAGNHLDGAFAGAFPTGNGRPGSNFLAVLFTSGQPALPASALSGLAGPGMIP